MPSLPRLLAEQQERLMTRLPFAITDVTEQQAAVLVFSDFIANSVCCFPAWWQQLSATPPQPDEWQHYADWLRRQLDNVADEAEFMRQLRQFRRHMLVRIAWMQTLSLASTLESLKQISTLAEVLIVAARDYVWRSCCQEMGTPCNAQGEIQPLLIIAMGKLGGGDLNFSSDVDLIFTWPESGATQQGRRRIDNACFFNRVCQRLIKVLDKPTEDGFVWRVDLRLRPFGESGPLVLNFTALEDYYQAHGQDWERYAMLKARLISDEDTAHQQALMQIVKPFVYRRYIDFSVIQSLRDMKDKITREVQRCRREDDIKLGAGGIREIEFIVQVFQLMRGGREPGLQTPSLLQALTALEQLAILDALQVIQLRNAWLFMRRLENLLQSLNDEQTHTLPIDALNRSRLAWAMQFDDWQQLATVLQQHRTEVRNIFNWLIGDNARDDEDAFATADDIAWWLGELDTLASANLLPHLTQEQQDIFQQLLAHFRQETHRHIMGQRGRSALDKLMPRLLRELRNTASPVSAFKRLAPLLLKILTRTTYLQLLVESPSALHHLVRLCATAPMIAGQLARYPLLLEELLTPTVLYQPIPTEAYRDQLQRYLKHIPVEDEEQRLEALRQFKQTKQLRIAACDINGTLPLMKVSDHLTWLAESIIEAAVQQAWQKVVKRHGYPAHLPSEQAIDLAVIGYGKLGGWELGYSSDLDLVFLHDCPEHTVTVGRQPIEGRHFYLRVVQHILHLFSLRTTSGILYEVDARLRPSGTAGMLVSSFDAFVDYQQHEAWIWEHQALVRARVIYAPPHLHTRFNAIRQRMLTKQHDPATLQSAFVSMRERKRGHSTENQKNCWDIKADPGGIVDIEFIAQFLVLRYASIFPELVEWTDNVRIFSLVARNGIMTNEEKDQLIHAYTSLRNVLHHQALQAQNSLVNVAALASERQVVMLSWQRWLLTPTCTE